MQKLAVIRPDFLNQELGVPVGNGYYRSKTPLPYRWVNKNNVESPDGDIFQIQLLGVWQNAQSIDFDFIEQ
jgi:hypothetical protein